MIILFLLFPVVTGFNDKLNYQKSQSGEGVEYTFEPPVHQYLSHQAYLLLSGEMKGEFEQYIGNDDACVSNSSCGDSDSGITITEGAYEEDTTPLYLNHFYNPNNDNETNMLCLPIGFCYTSAYERAEYLFNLSVYHYINKSNKELSYYYLGRVAHLLEDVSVPAHTHLDAHWGPFGDDSYEDYMAVHFREYNISSLMDYINTNNLILGEVSSSLGYESGYGVFATPNSNDMLEGGSSINNEDNFISLNNSLFSLFYDMAEISDDFDSDDVCGEVDECRRILGCDILGHCDVNEGNCSEIGDVLMPSAMRHVAGLYRLFWITTHKNIHSCGQEGDVVDGNHECCDKDLKIVDDKCLWGYDECSPKTVEEDCGESYCEWGDERYCVNRDVYVNKTCYYFECEEGKCVDNVIENAEFIKSCLRSCEDGVCIEDGLIVNHPVEMVYLDDLILIKLGYFVNGRAKKVDRLTYSDNGRERDLCRNCRRFNAFKNFADGMRSVVFRAYNGKKVIGEKEVVFYVDSMAPVIYRTSPSRGKINSNVGFSILFKEENLRKVTFYYDIGEVIRKRSLNIDDCIMDWRGRISCGVTLTLKELKELNGQKIKYWFGIEDVAENYVESSKIRVMVKL